MSQNKSQKQTQASQLKPIIRRQYNNTVYQSKENDQQFIKDLKTLASRSELLANPFKMNMDEDHINKVIRNAKIHQKANKTSDLRVLKNNSLQDRNNNKIRQKCLCGCRRQICQPIPLSTRLNQLSFLGTATLLYFFYLKLVNFIGCIFVVLGIYSFVTNLLGNGGVKEMYDCKQGYFCLFKVNTSFVKKSTQYELVQAQYWLSLGITVALIFISWFTTYYGKKIQKNAQIKTQFPSQKAIKISNIPFGRASQTMLLEALKETWLARKHRRANQKAAMQIKSLHIVYNMKFVRDLIVSIQQQAQYLSQGDVINLQTRKIKIQQNQYLQAKTKLIRNLSQLEDCLKRFKNEQQYRKNISTTCAIVEFQSQKQRDKFIQIFGIDSTSILSTMKKLLFKSYLDNITLVDGSALVFQTAPEPEDVYWKNCQTKQNVWVQMGILLAAFIIVLLSFGVFIAVDYGQLYLNNNAQLLQLIFDVINYCKTFLLIIFNKLIYYCLQKLLAKAKSHTLSQQKAYLILLSILAQSVNCIALPFIIQAILPNSYGFYGSQGVSGIAFDFAIINVLSFTALTFFDLKYFIFKFIIWVKCLRNMAVKYSCKGVDPESQKFMVNSVNKLYQAGKFDISESYSQIGVILLHMAFFSTMCPFIIIIYTLGFVVIYFLKRYLLITRYDYPQLLDKTIFIYGIKIIKITPIVLGLGMITTILVSYDSYPKLYIPSVICIFLGAINFINPCGGFDKFVIFLVQYFSKLFRIKPQTFQQEQISNLQLSSQNKQKTRYVEYHQTNHLSTLFGFKSILTTGVPSQDDVNKVKQFVQSFKYKQQFQFSEIKLNKFKSEVK